jgi:hypothetical protein
MATGPQDAPATPGRLSVACCSAGTSPSTQRPPSSSLLPSRPLVSDWKWLIPEHQQETLRRYGHEKQP